MKMLKDLGLAREKFEARVTQAGRTREKIVNLESSQTAKWLPTFRPGPVPAEQSKPTPAKQECWDLQNFLFYCVDSIGGGAPVCRDRETSGFYRSPDLLMHG